MAATYGRVQGFNLDGSPTAAEATRRGHSRINTEAATWRTFVKVRVSAIGSVILSVTRDGVLVHELLLGPELEASNESK